MSEVILHLKMPGPACAVCGVDLNRRVSRWWLVNCWTADPTHYRASQTCHPAETVRPCGVLDRNKTATQLIEAAMVKAYKLRPPKE